MRSAELRLIEGERRLGQRRQSRAAPSRFLTLTLVAAAAWAAYDVRYQNGRHTMVPATEAAQSVDAMAARMSAAAFGK